MSNVVRKYNVNDIEKINRLRNICFKVKRIGEITTINYEKLVNRDLNYIDGYYIKYFNKMDEHSIKYQYLIENSLYKSLHDKASEKRIGLIKANSFKESTITFFQLYVLNINKSIQQDINKYFNVLLKMRISRGDYKRFIALYLILKSKEIDKEFMENVLLTDIERKSLECILGLSKYNFKEFAFDRTYIKLIKAIEGYLKVCKSTIYDDDALKKIKSIKNITLKHCIDLGGYDIMTDIFDIKVKYFRNNFVSKGDLRGVGRFKFKSHIVQNTVFIKSKLDNWYIDVDKKTKQSVLYHGNDGRPDMYHYQKTFNSTDMFRIYKYIHEHDEYCIKRNGKRNIVKIGKGA